VSVDKVVGETARTELDAIEVRMQDQREVECLLREFEYLHTRREETTRVVRTACAELRMHDVLSTELFLPALVEAASDTGTENAFAAMEDAQQGIRDLIERVERADDDQEKRDAHFRVLAQHVGRHFHHTETQVFLRAKQLERLDLVSLAGLMKARQREMLAQI
jgi:hypothetical protein